jgi:hypothetical protein
LETSTKISGQNIGGCQLALFFRFYFSKSRTQALSMGKRFFGFSYAVMTIVMPILMTVNLVSTPIRLATGTPLVYFNDLEELRLLLRIQCGGIIVKWLHECHFAVLCGYHASIQETSFAVWMAPCWSSKFLSLVLDANVDLDFSTAIIRGILLPSWLGGTSPSFTPTGSLGDTLQERSCKRASLSKRINHIVLHCGVWFHCLIVISLSTAVWLSARAVFRDYGVDDGWDRELTIELLRYVLWPAPSWILAIFSCLVPIRYVLSPPEMPDRDQMLGMREKNGARYPVSALRDNRRTWYDFEYTQVYTLVAVGNIILLGATWWI